MKIVKQVITTEYLEQELREVSETLEDLSLVRLQLVNDSHYDCFDFTIEIYGGGIPDEVGPVVEIAFDVDDLLTEVNLFQGIDKKKIPSLFSQKLLDELIQRDIKIEFNYLDETAETLDLSEPGDGYLLAMVR
ncbi:MAG: hypothetical protein K8S18_13070 [Desulfobacula sp.]|nr:hypothetical protein [Desulfobacula sp.]